MGKRVPDARIDIQLDAVEGTNIHVCTSEPANYAGIAALQLATAVITGSFVKANGDTNGRKTTMPAQTGLDIDTDGIAGHVVISNGADTINNITTCAAQTLTSGGTVDVSPFSHEIADSV